MLRHCLVLIATLVLLSPVKAQDSDLQMLLQANRAAIEKASRSTIEPVLDALVASKLPSVSSFLEKWREKEVWQRKDDGRFFFARPADGGQYMLIDIATGAEAGLADKSAIDQLKPNSGVRAVIASTLVEFQLSDPDPLRRTEALTALERDANESHLEPLRGAIESETDPALKARKIRLERLITIRFGSDAARRAEAIRSFAGDLGVDARGALNPLVATTPGFAEDLPAGVNVARMLTPGKSIDLDTAYGMLVDADKAPRVVSTEARKQALIAHMADGQVGGIPVASLDTQEARDRAYMALVADGRVPPLITLEMKQAEVARYRFYEAYAETDPTLTEAAEDTLSSISLQVGFNRFLDLVLDGLSLASIYFLAAIGLAITFGVMGVINMAHGEFIMIGAYTGYVVQQFIPNYTASILLALPLAFAVAFLAGVALERLVIRHLAHRPLETLLATFGISIALQQIAKNIFGTQARPLTSPAWLDGAWVLNDVVSISYIRIAIFVLALVFLVLLLFILNRTRLGLEVRAVTQNPRMASSMGINPDRINMLTFGLGSGIAGIAGVAIGLFAKVTSELGSGYIVQSFMTVVVGGVGNIWGTLAGASMIGSLQKAIEFFNPSNTLAAQTYMIIFIIVFIQFRPKGIIALKGRAAGD
ncbi:urea ABC transporter permease subunit UrtB [Hoeflea marina]|nr:urea ABC transporter permease subunit UrtB [Hoeflea marina]